MLLGVFGAFGSGKTLYLVRKAVEAMNKCINCPKDIHPHMKHMHQTLRLKDGTLIKGRCLCMIPSEDRNKPPQRCPCTGFKPIRVLSNLNIKGAEQIGLPEFHNILTEDEVREYENEPEFKKLPNSRTDKRTDADIVTKFENAGFIVIHRDEIALVIIDEAWCVPSDTLLLGDNKQAKDLTLQDKVVTMNGLEDIVHLDTLYYSDDHGSCLQEIKAMGLLPIKVTPNHPLLTWTLKNRVPIEQGFVKASQLKPKGNYVAIPILQGSDATKISPSLAWLLGLYVAEGSVGDHQVFFSLNSNEQYLADKIKSIVSGRKVSQTQLARHTMNVYFTDRELVKLLPDLCGSNAHTKKIPDFILYNKNLEILRAFLEGYFLGDGYFIEQGIEAKTVSPLLAMQLQLAIARFGIPAYISKTSKYYRVTINADPQHKHAKVIQDKILYPILSNKTISYDGLVHNIVTPSHTFLVSNAITHNTWMDARMSGSQQNRAADVVILQCALEGSLVTLEDGTKVPIEKLRIGDYLADLQSSKRGRMRKHVSGIQKGVTNTILEIELESGHKVRVTPNHKFPVNYNGHNEQTDVEARRLKIGDYLKIDNYPLARERDTLAELFGAIAAEGSWKIEREFHQTKQLVSGPKTYLCYSNTLSLDFDKSETDFYSHISNILSNYSHVSEVPDKRNHGLSLSIGRREAVQLLWSKYTEFFEREISNAEAASFLRAFFEGDGHVSNNRVVLYQYESNQWKFDFALKCLRQLGIKYWTDKETVYSNLTKSLCTRNVCLIDQRDQAKFNALVGFISARKNRKLQQSLYNQYAKIKSITELKGNFTVYDISVGDRYCTQNAVYPYFILDGVRSHNSRKKSIDIAYSAQLPSSTDKRLRLNTEVAVIAKKIKKNRKVVAFRYVTASDTKCQVYRLPVEKAKTYYNLYSTRESVNRPMMFDEELNFRIRFLMEVVKKRKQRQLRDYQRMVLQTQKDAIERLQSADTSLEDSKKGTGPATTLLEIKPRNYPIEAEPLPEIEPVDPNTPVEYPDETNIDDID